MSVKERVRMCLLIEKIHKLKEYSERLGLEDVSTFNKKRVDSEEKGGKETCSLLYL